MKIDKFNVGDSFRAKYFRGLVTVTGVNESENILDVEIDPQEEGRYSWQESWNLLHTQWGFERGDYNLYKPAPVKSEFDSALDEYVKYHVDEAWREEKEEKALKASGGTVSYLDVLKRNVMNAAIKESLPVLNLED